MRSTHESAGTFAPQPLLLQHPHPLPHHVRLRAVGRELDVLLIGIQRFAYVAAAFLGQAEGAPPHRVVGVKACCRVQEFDGA